MCPECRMPFGLHDAGCPNADFEESEPEKVECYVCYREMYEDDEEHYVQFSNGDIVCNDCLREYCKENFT